LNEDRERLKPGCWSYINFEAAPALAPELFSTKLRLQSYVKLTALAPAVLFLTTL